MKLEIVFDSTAPNGGYLSFTNNGKTSTLQPEKCLDIYTSDEELKSACADYVYWVTRLPVDFVSIVQED